METVEALLDIPPLLRRPPTPGPWRPLERAAAPRPRPPWHVVHPAIVRAYLDGWRLCVVVAVGHRWAHLVEAGSLVHHRVPLDRRDQPLDPSPVERTKQLLQVPVTLDEVQVAWDTSSARVGGGASRTVATPEIRVLVPCSAKAWVQFSRARGANTVKSWT